MHPDPRESPPSRLQDVIAVVVLLVAVSWPFRDTLVGPGCMLSFDTRRTGFAPFQVERPEGVDARPANLVTSDINGWIVPETALMVRELRAGRLPLWNPYVLCGQPLLANLAFAPFYPPNVLALVVEPMRALAWITVLHFWLAGLFVYVWLRRFGLRPGASLVGALAGALSTWFTTRFHLPTVAMTAAWFPGMLLAFESILARPRVRGILGLTVCVGGAALAGFPQLLVLELLGLGVYGLARTVQVRASVLRVGASCASAVLIGVLLGGVQLIPAWALFDDSLRAAFASQVAAQALRGAALLGALHPYAFGDPITLVQSLARLEDYVPHRLLLGADIQENAVENALWIGALPLAFVAAALASLRRRSAAFALVVVAVVGLVLAFGLPIPLLQVGSPKRALVLVVVPLALLAGIGCDAISRRGLRSGSGIAAMVVVAVLAGITGLATFAPAWVVDALLRRVGASGVIDADRAIFVDHLRATSVFPFAITCAAAVALGSFAWRWSIAVAACVAVVAVDLGAFARHFNPAQERAGQYPATAAVTFVREANERTVRAHDLTPLPASIGPLLGYRSADGAEPMVTRRIAELYEALEPGRFDPRDPRMMRPFTDMSVFAHPLFLRTATAFVVANRELPLTDADVVYANEAEGLGVYRLRGALPRVRLVAGWSVVGTEERLASLRDPTVDPRRLVQIDASAAHGIASGPGPLDAPLGSARIVAETPTALTIELDGVERRVWLVVADTFDDGWNADEELRDGTSRCANVEVADHAFRAVEVGPETQRVTLRYEPRSFRWGVSASLFALAVVALGGVLGARARRRSHPDIA